MVSAQSTDRPPELAAKITAALDRLARAQRRARQTVATDRGLTPLQLDLLAVLAAGQPPEPTVGQLAMELAVTQPTATDALRSLGDKGLIERRRDAADGRRSLLALTPEGERLAHALRRTDGSLTSAIAELPVAVQEATFEALLTVIAKLVATGAIDVARTCLTCRYHRHDGTTHRCALLEIDLPTAGLRVNCPDHEAA